MESGASLLAVWIAMGAVAQEVTWRYYWNIWRLVDGLNYGKQCKFIISLCRDGDNTRRSFS